MIIRQQHLHVKMWTKLSGDLHQGRDGGGANQMNIRKFHNPPLKVFLKRVFPNIGNMRFYQKKIFPNTYFPKIKG